MATEQTRRDEINFPRSVMAVLAPLMAVVLVAASDQTIVAAGPAPSTGLLIAFRALPGIGGGGLSPLVQAITGDLIPARQRGKYQSYVGSMATFLRTGTEPR